MATERLIMIPGMGADHRLFEPQRAFGFDFEVPDLPVPRNGENLPAYASRIREQLALDGPCVLGGVSFGGMLACELARLCRPRFTLLIASCRGREAIPRYYWPAEWVSRLLPDALIRSRVSLSSRLIAQLESLSPEQRTLVEDMARDVPIPYLRAVGRMILSWDGETRPAGPIVHIHGDRDKIIPLRRVRPDEVVHGGGHLINLTHAEQVNQFIARCLQRSG